VPLHPCLISVLGIVLVGGLAHGATPALGTEVDAPAAAPTVCTDEGGTSAVKAPRFVRTIATAETGWFSSPGLVDLDGDGRLDIVAPFSSTFVFDAKGHELGRGTATEGGGSMRRRS